MSLFDLSGKVALVTGGTKGIGRGIVEQLAAQGAKVIVSSRTQADAEKVAGELNDSYGKGEVIAKGIAGDISQREQVTRLADAARKVWEQIDVLVCNASALSYIGDSRDTPPEDFDNVLITNIHHNYKLVQAVRADMASRGGGAVILIGSVAGHVASPMTLAYGVSKAGVAHLARSLADELAPERIRVNCVAPGLIRSFSSEKIWKHPDRLDVAQSTIPLGRIGEPNDIAGAVVFLASDAGSYVTGTTVHVDGGRATLPLAGRKTHLSGVAGHMHDTVNEIEKA